jgi:hypothetical protein
MLPVKTTNSNHDFGPPRGREDEIGHLPCQIVVRGGQTLIRSVWKLSGEERACIAEGFNVELEIAWIGAFPPLSLNVTDEKEHRESDEI